MVFKSVKKATLFIGAALAITALQIPPTLAESNEYSFSVTNNTRTRIRQILVSEDGKQWGYFDIGRGISPGETSELVWDQSTNGESCAQWIKAVYADGSEARPAKFDFCEETDLVFD